MSIPSFVKGQIFANLPVSNTSFAGKTIIVTGANTGLGLDCAKHLARLDASRVILACRSVEKGEKAKQAIATAHRSSRTKVEVWQLDMASYASVLAFADRVDAELDRLDGVVENAGVSLNQFTLADGDETTLTVNVISTFLLAILLLPKLRETAAQFSITPHIAVVGSVVHAFAQKKELTAPKDGQILQTLSDEKTAQMSSRYYLSKLLVILWVRELAARIETSGKDQSKAFVVVNNTAPGWCKTELFRQEYASWPLPQKLLFNAIGRESEEGSRTLVHALTAGRESHGQYLSECQVKAASSFVNSKEGGATQQRIWGELSEKLEAIRPDVMALV
ncbi:MAG: hypothetical protein LQ340_000173 [Diploschistes diacapsis]|nr:MAG: hypothetical protein LQ340_000173 [Diploschistes diacapsis]